MSRPWFPFYVGDYVRDTARLSTEAHGAYLLLMLDYWPNGAPPDDDAVLATITKLSKREWKAMRPLLIVFFKVSGGKWNHARIDKERALADEKHQKRVEAGGKGGKAKAKSEHCSSNATSADEAKPYQPQSQPPSESNPNSKKGESNSPSKNFDVIEGGLIKIDETYEPSDRATEYAFSLGMKKIDLNSELSKFIASSMATRAVSYNPDMSFKVWCDRWLDFQRKNNPERFAEKPETPAVELPEFLIIEGTLEHTCWNQHRRSIGQVSMFMCRQQHPDTGAVVVAGRAHSLFPPGYDEQTGEKLSAEPIGDVA